MDQCGSPSMFKYTPLDPNVDSIRLVVLEPGQQSDGIRCRIRHVTFGERPKYQAISYTWGDHPADREISIDGKSFLVGPNLHEALSYLRDIKNECVFWIDAICINQADVHERNRQISIMPHIYTRAQVVVVWLGILNSNLVRSEDGLDWAGHIKRIWSSFFSEPNQANTIGGRILKAMCNESYWSRLWIIQEICLARRVKICYGNNTVDWKDFIRAVSKLPLTNSKDNVPMKLHEQLSEKYKGGHKLKKLLKNHQHALCKEPRDHVYGFVGLATDCIEGFPLDYQKSLFEVWKDTIMYKNADHEATRHDIMEFGRLVQRLLGGHVIATIDELTEDIGMRMARLPPKRDSLHLSARLSGRIRFLGPTYNEIIADLKKTAAWKASINQHIPAQYLPAAMEESDMFLEVLEGIDDKDLMAVVNFDPEMLWDIPETSTVVPDVKVFRGDANWDEGDMALDDRIATDGNPVPDSSVERRLFLLHVRSNHLDSPGVIGLAPPNAQFGDYILQVQGITRALVIRMCGRVLTIVGTAVLAENHDKGRLTRETYAEKGIRFGTAEFAYREADSVEMVLDVAVAYHLLL